MEPLSDREKRAIMFLHDNENVSWNTLSLAFNKPPETLLKAIQRFRAVADLPPKIIVKNNKIDPQIGRELKQMVKESPKTPYRELKGILQDRMPDITDLPSSSTIQRYLSKSGYKRIKLLKKALIHPRNITKRLKYAENMKGKGSDFWDTVVWSDETSVAAMAKGKEVKHWVHKSTKREDMPVNGQIVGGGFSVMFWGCFTKMGLGPLWL
jgi:hypothetical protein